MLRHIGNVSDALEGAVVAILGTGLFLSLALGVPYYLVRALLEDSRPWTAAMVAALTLLNIASVVRDVVRKRWGWVSIAVAGGWLLCVGWVFIRLSVMG